MPVPITHYTLNVNSIGNVQGAVAEGYPSVGRLLHYWGVPIIAFLCPLNCTYLGKVSWAFDEQHDARY